MIFRAEKKKNLVLKMNIKQTRNEEFDGEKKMQEGN